MTYYKELVLDISGTENPTLCVKSSGKHDRFILCTLQKEGNDLATDGVTRARVAITKPDNAQVFADCSLSDDRGIVFALTPEMLAVPGKVRGELLLFEGDALSFRCPFSLEITPQEPNRNRLQSSDEYSDLLNAVSDVRAAIAWCDESAKNAARCASLADSAARFLSKEESLLSRCLPIGALFPFAGDCPPQGFFFCDGAKLSKRLYSGLFSVIGERYGTESDANVFSLPKLPGDPFVWIIAAGTLTIDYATQGLFLDLDRRDNTRKGENPNADYWEDLCGGPSLFLSQEERVSRVLSDEHCELLYGYLKRAASVELVTSKGTFSFLREGSEVRYFLNSNPIRPENPDPGFLLFQKEPLFAVRLYHRPLRLEELTAHAQTDRLRFSKIFDSPAQQKGGIQNVL